MSSYLSNAIAALIISNTPVPVFTGAQRYLALHTVDPTKTCLVGELSTANYSRVLVPITEVGNPEGNDITNNGVLVFPVASQTIAQQITHFSIWDAPSGGNPVTYGKLITPVNWTLNSSLSLAINAFVTRVRNKIVG